jgi:hypothetical protein
LKGKPILAWLERTGRKMSMLEMGYEPWFLVLSIVCCLGIAHAGEANVTPNILSLEPGGLPPEATIADAAWIAGHWAGEAFGGIGEEIWSKPAGGSMMGMYRIVKDGAVGFYEFLTISEMDSSRVLRLKHFHADLKGWEEKDDMVTFPLVKIDDDNAYFDGITFKRLGNDKLQIFLAQRTMGGTIHELEFMYDRAGEE